MATARSWAEVTRKKPLPVIPTTCAVNLERYSTPVRLPPSSSRYSTFLPLPTGFTNSKLLDILADLPNTMLGALKHWYWANDIFYLITFKDQQLAAKHKRWLSRPPSGANLAMTIKKLLAPSNHERKNGRPPRPQQSFILYRKNYSALHPNVRLGKASHLAKEAWNACTRDVRDFYSMLAEVAKDVMPMAW